MDSLELKVNREDVLGFYRDTAPQLAAIPGASLDFYINSINAPYNYSSQIGAYTRPLLEEYRHDAKILYKYLHEENELFRIIMDYVEEEMGIDDEAALLFNLYSKIIEMANKIKKTFDESENKSEDVKKLIESVQSWAGDREKMYDPLTRDAYLKPFLDQYSEKPAVLIHPKKTSTKSPTSINKINW